MGSVLWVLLAAALVVPTWLAHTWLPRHAENRAALWLLRLVLLAAGVLAGYRGLLYAGAVSELRAVAVFVAGFGLVHVPAFFVLLIKRRRGEYGRG